MAPIDMLTDDCLEAIFGMLRSLYRLTDATDVYSALDIARDSAHALFNASLVCRRWHLLASDALYETLFIRRQTVFKLGENLNKRGNLGERVRAVVVDGRGWRTRDYTSKAEKLWDVLERLPNIERAWFERPPRPTRGQVKVKRTLKSLVWEGGGSALGFAMWQPLVRELEIGMEEAADLEEASDEQREVLRRLQRTDWRRLEVLVWRSSSVAGSDCLKTVLERCSSLRCLMIRNIDLPALIHALPPATAQLHASLVRLQLCCLEPGTTDESLSPRLPRSIRWLAVLFRAESRTAGLDEQQFIDRLAHDLESLQVLPSLQELSVQSLGDWETSADHAPSSEDAHTLRWHDLDKTQLATICQTRNIKFEPIIKTSRAG